MTETHTISMPEKIWVQVFEYAKKNSISKSSVFQLAVTEFLHEDVIERNYRLVDVVFITLIFVVILLLLVVIL